MIFIFYSFRAFMFFSLLQFSCFAYSQIDEDSVFFETLELKEIQRFHSKEQKSFYSLPNIENLTLQLKNSLPESAWSSKQDQYLNVKIRCDKPVHLNQSPSLFNFNQSRKHRFRLYASHNNAQKTYIVFNDQNTKCTLALKFPFDKGYNYSLELLPEMKLYSKTFQNLLEPESCVDYRLDSEPNRFNKNKNSFFLKNYNILGCAQRPDEIVFLEDPFKAFNERMKLLTGSDIPIEVFETQDWTYEPDFSKAPELDLIILSTLQFKSDVLISYIMLHKKNSL